MSTVMAGASPTKAGTSSSAMTGSKWIVMPLGVPHCGSVLSSVKVVASSSLPRPEQWSSPSAVGTTGWPLSSTTVMRKGRTGSSRDVHPASEPARASAMALERIAHPQPPLRERWELGPRPRVRLGAEQDLVGDAHLVPDARLLVASPRRVAVAPGALAPEGDARVRDAVRVEGDARRDVAPQDEAVDGADALRDDDLAHLERQRDAEEPILERAHADARVPARLSAEAVLEQEAVEPDDEVEVEARADVGPEPAAQPAHVEREVRLADGDGAERE